MEVEVPNGEKIYNLTAGKTLPEWISDAKKHSLKKDAEYRGRIELIQDLFFPGSCQRIKYTPNGEFLVATGVYPPQVKAYQLRELSVSFDRRLDNSVVQFQILSEDVSKMVFLRCDRTLEFHSQQGKYYTLRVPKAGRDLMYDYASCDLLITGTSSEVYRLNLEKGTFLKPLLSSCPAINTCGINPQHGLYAFGGEDGIAEFWDPRTRKPVAFLDVAAHVTKLTDGFVEGRSEITALRFHNDGLTTAFGSSTGQCLLYDMRMSEPFQMKDHNYGVGIVDIKFHETRNIVSACHKIVKVWNMDTKEAFCSIQPPEMEKIEDICIAKNNGILFIAGEQQKINAYYIPGLGHAPSWCRFLDNLTEELEESKNKMVIYTDYKFVTRKDLQQMGVEKMIGTPFLRAYMHGFFVDIRLYNRIRAIANPTEYHLWKKEKIRHKMEQKRQSRISVHKKLPKVNKNFAEELLSKSRGKLQNPQAEDLLSGRFSRMFSDPDFYRNPDSNVLAMRKRHAKPEKEIEENFKQLEDQSDDEEEDDDEDDDDDDDDDDDEEEQRSSRLESEGDILVEELQNIRTSSKKSRAPIHREKSEGTRDQSQKKRKIRFFEAKNDSELPLEDQPRPQKRRLEGTTFTRRLQLEKETKDDSKVSHVPFGPMKLTFTPEEDKKKIELNRAQKKGRKEKNKGRRSMRQVHKTKKR